jgi:hypothetical protein
VAGEIGQTVPYVPSGLSLSPPQEENTVITLNKVTMNGKQNGPRVEPSCVCINVCFCLFLSFFTTDY